MVGAVFGGIAVIAWAGRSAEPSKSRDAMVLGFTVLNGLAALASVWGALSGVYNSFAWGPVATFALCAAGFFLVGRAGMSVSPPQMRPAPAIRSCAGFIARLRALTDNDRRVLGRIQRARRE